MTTFNNPFSSGGADKTIEDDGGYGGGNKGKYSGGVSVSDNFLQQFGKSNSPASYDSHYRNYVEEGMGKYFGHSLHTYRSPTIHSGVQIHEQTANLANIGVTDGVSDGEGAGDDNEHGATNLDEVESDYHGPVPPIPIGPDSRSKKSFSGPDAFHKVHGYTSSITPLKELSMEYYTEDLGGKLPPEVNSESQGLELQQDHLASSDHWRRNSALKSLMYIPAVFLGTLLNILDGLSYGMIMFPLSEAVFSSLAPTGLSMFYVSCIISQLVYSLGGSAFKAGIGSEMIEVTPFFHSMAFSILNEFGGDPEKKTAIIATTITTYSISSIITGLVFYLLGKLRLGVLVGFFPRHILVGCIGGVGYFLLVTAIAVSSRLEGGIKYDFATLKHLFCEPIVFLEWVIPLLMTVVLVILQHRFKTTLLVPLYFIGVFVLFHLLVYLIPGWSLKLAREFGWVFPSVKEKLPWYGFYELYQFQYVDWFCVLKQLPTMLALAFFGLLHVPINVPALAVTLGMDKVDVDRELVAHGYSNALSGLVGSIQNYLVYTNSVLFIRAGADSRVAGVMLAIATGIVMVAGPGIIGCIPVCVVGSLIYLLGYELLKEALYDTWGKLRSIEYFTIFTIVVVMGAWDFVYGVLVGILLACLLFVIEAARRPVVRGIYTGVVARSTVLRHPKQQEFLKDVGDQICVIKLEGTVFFGSIGGVEDVIRSIFSEQAYKKNLIRFLILDLKGVVSIDFSAAEGFRRILNLMNSFGVQLIISSVSENDSKVVALRDAGLWDTKNELDIQLFDALNYALEWCENSFLVTYKSVGKVQKNGPRKQSISKSSRPNPNQVLDSDMSKKSLFMQVLDGAYGTPRSAQVIQAAQKTVKDEQRIHNRYFNSDNQSFKKEPLPIIMTTFQGLSDKDEKFWASLTPYFVKEKIPSDLTFYDNSKDKPSFFIVELGLIRSVCKFESDGRELHSSILPMTAFGDLFEKGTNARGLIYTTVSDTVVWKLSESKVEELLKSSNGISIFNELLKIDSKLVKERFDTMTANLVLSA